MFNKLLDNKKDSFTFHGFYRGIVVNNNDPKQNGAIKVKVYPMFKNIVDNDLPWATYADSFMGGSSNVGGIFIPVVGAHVYVFFENADHRYPVYFAGAPAISGGTPDIPTAAATGYPNNHVYRSKEGIQIEIDNTPGAVRLQIRHPSGTNKKIDNAGAVTEVIVSDETINITGDQSITVGGGTTIDIGGAGTIDIGTNLDLTVTGNTTITTTGTTNINSTGVTTVTSPTTNIIASTGVTMTTPLCTITGLLSCAGLGVGTAPVAGESTLSGNLTITGGDVDADGITLKTHVHVENGDGGGVTDPAS